MRKTCEGKKEMEEDEEHNASCEASLPTWPAALVPVLVDSPQLDAFHFHTRPRFMPVFPPLNASASSPRRHRRPTLVHVLPHRLPPRSSSDAPQPHAPARPTTRRPSPSATPASRSRLHPSRLVMHIYHL